MTAKRVLSILKSMSSVNAATFFRRLSLLWRGLSQALRRMLLLALLVIALLVWATWAVVGHSEQAMGRLFGEKGASLIMVVESILRSGLRHEIGVRLQALLEEMSQSRDVLFAAVTMPDGTILAHSDVSRLGDILRLGSREISRKDIQALAPTFTPQWAFMELEGRRVFAVYRLFAPGLETRSCQMALPTMFLGLDARPLELRRWQNLFYIGTLAGASLLVVLLGFAALILSERTRTLRRKQEHAEGQVRELQAEVRRKEKLAAVGSLAAGVAHEIRNPLSSIKGYATYFGQLFPEGSENRASAQIMVNEVDRLNRVICDLIGLAKPSDIVRAPMPVEPLLQDVARLIAQQAEAQAVCLKICTGRALPDIMADSQRLHQALLNLCLNALQAMPHGGCLTLGAYAGRDRLWLWVRDNGLGIAKEALSHIFDPYYTTRASGTGLGLALVQKIVDAHGGSLMVRSREEHAERRGLTLFCIALPLGENHGSADTSCRR